LLEDEGIAEELAGLLGEASLVRLAMIGLLL